MELAYELAQNHLEKRSKVPKLRKTTNIAMDLIFSPVSMEKIQCSTSSFNKLGVTPVRGFFTQKFRSLKRISAYRTWNISFQLDNEMNLLHSQWPIACITVHFIVYGEAQI